MTKGIASDQYKQIILEARVYMNLRYSYNKSSTHPETVVVAHVMLTLWAMVSLWTATTRPCHKK